MLRMPEFEVHQPATAAEAVALRASLPQSMYVAGGTDLYPNLKHHLHAPSHLVSLGRVEGFDTITMAPDGALRLGAGVTLHTLATSTLLQQEVPGLALAASLVAGPQHRRMGTLGGNVMLDTRCRYINQTHFWRKSLGYCLKKDGTLCHVVAGGRKCVAAASNDSAPALMTLGGMLTFKSAKGSREVLIDELWHTDGIYNKKAKPDELLVSVRVPPQKAGHRGAYGKLRERGSFDFPQLGIAVRLDLDARTVADADVVVVALQARPLRIKGAADMLRGKNIGDKAFEDAARQVADRAFQQCHPMPNIPGDPDYRREMVPVYVRKTLLAAAGLGERPLS